MTTLILPRYGRGPAPESRDLARLIAHDCGVPSSWEVNANVTVDANRSVLVVDLFDTDPARAADACRTYCDQHEITWSIR
jgi:hypothetical protein